MVPAPSVRVGVRAVGQGGILRPVDNRPFSRRKGVRRLTTVAQLAKLPHKYRAHIAQDLRRTTLALGFRGDNKTR